MVYSVRENMWMRRLQCPCGEWNCFLTCEKGDDNNINNASLPIINNQELENSSAEAVVCPYVGMVFDSEDDAFEYYGNFARKNGFSIRKERSRLSPQLGIYKRNLVCYRSGFASAQKKTKVEHQRDRKSNRCGCDARMLLSKELADGVLKWFVVQFSNMHNHELLEDDQVHLLPAYRRISEVAQDRILLLLKAGFPVHKIYKVLEKERRNQGGKVTFFEKDVRNFIQSRKKIVQESNNFLNEKRESDMVELIEAFRATKERDSDFVYDVTTVENGKVENVVWSYGESIRFYGMFGDVVYFDSTYCLTAHGMIFGAWFGFDNLGRSILFGCTLLPDGTTMSYVWALQTFLHFMKGRCPITILTDLDPGLTDAIKSVLHGTNHVIPLYNILPKLSCWFSLPLGVRYVEFRNEFDALSNVDNADDFEFRWNHLVDLYGLSSDRHIAFLFSIRTSWASPYTRRCFLAMMGSTGYSKSVEILLKGFFRANTCLRSFFEKVGVSSALKFQVRGDIKYAQIRTCLPMEEHARSILTPYAFNVLQQELALSMQYAVSEMNDKLYLVSHFKKIEGVCHVTWNSEDKQISCSCKLFESSGILCRHALRVFLAKNYFEIPEKYFPSRWRQERSVFAYDDGSSRAGNDEWYDEFRSLSVTLFRESSVIKTRSEYVRIELKRELTRLVNEVRNMPVHDTVAMDETPLTD